MAPRAVVAPIAGWFARAGKKAARYPTNPTEMAAFPDQMLIQYPHATRNAGRFPRPSRVYAYGPPTAGMVLPHRARTTARVRAPAVVNPQPSKLIPPKGARDAGRR